MSRRKNEKTPWGFIGVALLLFGAFFVRWVYAIYWEIKTSSPEWKTSFKADFPGLKEAAPDPGEKRAWLVQKANKEFCSCECGYTLAACLKGDLNCPIRDKNMSRIRDMAAEYGKH